ncbi:MAG: hypothetical protein WCE44_02100 [Candidatus Velthaea sp.]
MALASSPAALSRTAGTPIAVRLIGILDRPLIDVFSEWCGAMLAGGPRTLVVKLADVQARRDESFRRFVALLESFRAAGCDIRLNPNASWRRLLRDHRASFSEADLEIQKATRRQLIVANSMEKRVGR